jgi:hypothetical protein
MDTKHYITQYEKFKHDTSSPEFIKLKKSIKSYINKNNEEIKNCCDLCNLVVYSMIDTVSNEFPGDFYLGICKELFEKIKSKSPEEPISAIVINIYSNDEYKNNILEENDAFFINDNFSNIVNKDAEKKIAIFQFKSCWAQMTDDMRTYIKQSMKTVINICERYIILKANNDDVINLL